LNALDGKRIAIKAVEFSQNCSARNITIRSSDPSRAGYRLEIAGRLTEAVLHGRKVSFDLIEFWNLRALDGHIEPLPASLAPSLIDYCNEFINQFNRPFPPPSNAYHHASLLCAKSQSIEAERVH